MYFLIAAALFTLLNPFVAPQTIDPNSVPIGTRQQWCTNQEASCPLLCTQVGGNNSPTSNTCDAVSFLDHSGFLSTADLLLQTTLSWSCVCNNGISPNASAFSQTIPFYECQESNNQCANNCQGNSACVSSCQTAHPCGAQSPPRINATSSASGTASATGSGTKSSSTSGEDPNATGFFGSSSTPSASAGGNILILRVTGAAESCGFVVLLSLVAGVAFTL